MALKPVLRLKVDELFMKWITDKAVQSSLQNSLRQILKGEIVTYATPQVNYNCYIYMQGLLRLPVLGLESTCIACQWLMKHFMTSFMIHLLNIVGFTRLNEWCTL